MDKPKRTLTEAQRLAFLKGREKRMANIEKKRLETEEKNAAVAEIQPDPDPVPVTPDEKPQPQSPAAPEPEPVVVPPVPKLKRAPRKTTTPAFVLDEDKIANRVAEEVMKKMQELQPPPKERKPRKPRAKPLTPEKGMNAPPPPAYNFSWL